MGKPCSLSHSRVWECDVSSTPVRAPTPYAQKESGRDAVIDESFWRREPAAALRGFGVAFFSSATRRSFSARKPERGMYTSPRTSSSAGALSPSIRSGIEGIVRRLVVTSSPTSPSPRVAPRVKTPSS